MADKKALKLINKNTSKMVEQIKADLSSIAGLRWDDCIIRLEWKAANNKIEEEVKDFAGKAEVLACIESHQYKFNIDTVKKWKEATGISFVDFIS